MWMAFISQEPFLSDRSSIGAKRRPPGDGQEEAARRRPGSALVGAGWYALVGAGWYAVVGAGWYALVGAVGKGVSSGRRRHYRRSPAAPPHPDWPCRRP